MKKSPQVELTSHFQCNSINNGVITDFFGICPFLIVLAKSSSLTSALPICS